MGARIIANKPFIVKPGTIIEANQSNIPFKTNENNPKVTKVSGRDRSCRIGLIKALTSPIMIAANKAAGKLAISTPGTIRSTMRSPKAVANIVTKYPIIFLFSSNSLITHLIVHYTDFEDLRMIETCFARFNHHANFLW